MSSIYGIFTRNQIIFFLSKVAADKWGARQNERPHPISKQSAIQICFDQSYKDMERIIYE